MSFVFSSHWKYLPIFGGFLLHISVGYFYSAGHIMPHINKFMKNENKTSTWIFGSTLLGMGAAMSLGGYMEMKIGSSLTVLIGGWIMSANICLMCVTMTCGLTVVILTYGLFAGFGTGLVYGVALGVPLRIVKKCVGLFLGVVVSGFGASATIFDYLQNVLSSGYTNLPLSFLIMGCIYAVIQFIGAILLKKKANEFSKMLNLTFFFIVLIKNDLTIQSDETSFNYFETFLNSKSKMEFKPHEILLELDFWILWITFFLNAFGVNFLTTLYNEYYHELFGAQQLVTISTSGAAFNCLGRIFWGFIIDKKPFKITMVIMTVGTSILMALFATISLMNLTGKMNEIVFGIIFCAINFFQSGNFSIFPFICAQLYGVKYFVCNYGMLFTACSVACTIVNIISMNISREKDNLKFVFVAGAALSILSTLMILVYRGKSLIIRTNALSIL